MLVRLKFRIDRLLGGTGFAQTASRQAGRPARASGVGHRRPRAFLGCDLGIHDIHTRQAKRYSPLPDYDLSQPEAVKMTIYGTVADSTYAHLLMQNKGMPLSDIILLDRVQKPLPVPKYAI